MIRDKRRGESDKSDSPRLLITHQKFYDIIEQIKIIESEINNVKEEILRGFTDPLSNNALLDFVSGSSKRIRSVIAILYLKAHQKNISNVIYSLLAAGELIHDASLLQDDVLDNAETRRGKSSIARQFSSKISILAGDYLLSSAMEKLLNINNNEVLEIFRICTKKMSSGEIKQYFLRGKQPTLEEYLEVCKDKTAALFSAILTSSALICGLEIETAGQFADKFGTAFQIKNDLEESSALLDKKNKISTAIAILGVEKTELLLDNYREEMRNLLKDIPDNSYKKALEELITVYV